MHICVSSIAFSMLNNALDTGYKLSITSGFGLVWFNATFNNISVISWWSVLLVEETGRTRRKPPTCQTLSHNVVHIALRVIRTNFCNEVKLKYNFRNIEIIKDPVYYLPYIFVKVMTKHFTCPIYKSSELFQGYFYIRNISILLNFKHPFVNHFLG